MVSFTDLSSLSLSPIHVNPIIAIFIIIIEFLILSITLISVCLGFPRDRIFSITTSPCLTNLTFSILKCPLHLHAIIIRILTLSSVEVSCPVYQWPVAFYFIFLSCSLLLDTFVLYLQKKELRKKGPKKTPSAVTMVPTQDIEESTTMDVSHRLSSPAEHWFSPYVHFTYQHFLAISLFILCVLSVAAAGAIFPVYFLPDAFAGSFPCSANNLIQLIYCLFFIILNLIQIIFSYTFRISFKDNEELCYVKRDLSKIAAIIVGNCILALILKFSLNVEDFRMYDICGLQIALNHIIAEIIYRLYPIYVRYQLFKPQLLPSNSTSDSLRGSKSNTTTSKTSSPSRSTSNFQHFYHSSISLPPTRMSPGQTQTSLELIRKKPELLSEEEHNIRSSSPSSKPGLTPVTRVPSFFALNIFSENTNNASSSFSNNLTQASPLPGSPISRYQPSLSPFPDITPLGTTNSATTSMVSVSTSTSMGTTSEDLPLSMVSPSHFFPPTSTTPSAKISPSTSSVHLPQSQSDSNSGVIPSPITSDSGKGGGVLILPSNSLHSSPILNNNPEMIETKNNPISIPDFRLILQELEQKDSLDPTGEEYDYEYYRELDRLELAAAANLRTD